MLKIKCYHCKKHIYNYHGRAKRFIESRLVEPVKKEYNKPIANSETKCPECGKNIFATPGPIEKEYIKQWRKKLQQNL